MDIKGKSSGKSSGNPSGKSGKKASNSSGSSHHTYAPAKTNNLEGWPAVKGLDFSKKFDIKALLDSYASTGFQATNLAQAVDIIRQMRASKSTIFLSCTSNLVTSGLRDVIRWLVENKLIDVLVVSAGGIEEDLIKTLKPFVIGSFEAPGKMLFNEGVNRAGNIFIPNDRYVAFEEFIDPILDELFKEQKKSGKVIDSCELINELGARIAKHPAAKENFKESILYWAVKNKIPVFCPCITDGSLGDLIFFQKQRNPDFKLDISGDLFKIVKLCLNSDKTGVVCLGGGTPKHFVLNAQLFRDGCDFAVFINTAAEFDGSDSGARPDEAVSWGKIKAASVANSNKGINSVKVTADATIVFPIVVAGAFAE